MSTISTSTTLDISLVIVDGQDISNFLASGSTIEWYDVSKNSGRETSNANGDIILNVINDKYKLNLVTRPLTDNEVVEFYRQIGKRAGNHTVIFRNPFDGNKMTTKTMYRGDRQAEMLQPFGGSLLFNSISQSLIEQ